MRKIRHTVIVLVGVCAGLVSGCQTLASAAPIGGSSRDHVKHLVVREARNLCMKPSLALAVARVESDFRVTAESHVGARGVMQIMPATARGEYGIKADQLWNARINVRLGIHFLKRLIKQYNGRHDLALSHYNGGTIRNGRIHSYTRGYVRKVLGFERQYRSYNNGFFAVYCKFRSPGT